MQQEHSAVISGAGPGREWCVQLDANAAERLVWEWKSRPAKEFGDRNEVVCGLTGADGCSELPGCKFGAWMIPGRVGPGRTVWVMWR